MKTKKSPAKSMELLAPAGSFAAFDAAVMEGADAVYLGAPDLNARALSRDFTLQELEAMVRYAHGNTVKVYIAMNSLVRESEMQHAVESLSCFEDFGVDGVILQDIGLFSLAVRRFPGLSLHASTLMSVHNSLAVRSFLELGGKRTVLPRELTIDEIGTIFERTAAELEVFVHGAMCFSYSGLCLFSSLHGGKSSLRGQCVQPCRRRYSWLKKKSGKVNRKAPRKEGGYIFSMNDLCGIDLLPELARAGVGSLKIEGRLKSAEYVRKTVRAYRMVLDSLDKKDAELRKILTRARRLLNEAMGRRWSTGFFLDVSPPEAVTPQFSGNVGTMVGFANDLDIKTVQGQRSKTVIHATLRQTVQVGDRLRLHNEHTGERTSFTLHSLWLGRKKVRHGAPGQTVRIESMQKFSDKPLKKFKGKLFRVDIGSGQQEEKKARKKILQYGSGIEVSGGKIPEVLRAEISPADGMVKHVSQPEGSCRSNASPRKKGSKPNWWVKLSRFGDMQCRLPFVPARYVLPMTEENVALGLKYHAKHADRIVWSMPPVIEEHRVEWYNRTVFSLAGKGYAQYQLGHFLQFAHFDDVQIDQGHFRLFADYTCNILNSHSLGLLKRSGYSGGLFSIETDRENLAGALEGFSASHRDFLVGMYVYGRPSLFSARLDAAHFLYGKRFVSPRGEEYTLGRLDGMTVARSVNPYSLLTEWQDIARQDIDYLYVDLSFGHIKRSLSEFIGHYHKGRGLSSGMTGNYLETLA